MAMGESLQCFGMSMPLSFVAGFVSAPAEAAVPGSVAAAFQASWTRGGNLLMLLKNVVTCQISELLRVVFHAGIPLKRTPCWMM